MTEMFNSLQDSLESPSEKLVKTVSGEVLTPKYSFENFVVGKSNQFAHASAMAVANKLGVYNPLFIVGKTGLGKTHLQKAIGYRLLSVDPAKRVCYVSTQHFIEEVISALRDVKLTELKEKYQNGVDILLMDDIQFLSRAHSTQDQFFNVFNALFDSGKQIVVTSDRYPKEIADVHDRIISRFEWGMVADIESPELETRVAILKSRAEADNIPLSDEVAYLIGNYVKANVRELEGCLTKLAAHAAIYNVEITSDLVKKVLKSYISENRRIVNIDNIIAVVAQYYSLKASDLKGSSRKAPVAKARQVVMSLARELSNMSCSAIGQALGNRHHTTILHGTEFISNLQEKDSVFKNQLGQIRSQLMDNL
ncbi:chromosomal replication initiator protein DnaA [bacterium]|nr:chromosomal replication initiator protein DnaA [bacterium]